LVTWKGLCERDLKGYILQRGGFLDQRPVGAVGPYTNGGYVIRNGISTIYTVSSAFMSADPTELNDKSFVWVDPFSDFFYRLFPKSGKVLSREEMQELRKELHL